MGAYERRQEIMRILCRRRHETVSNLANEFMVSTRTILRDIEILSLSEPIYTKCGRYGGGIYVMDDYSISRMYMTTEEIEVITLLQKFIEKSKSNILNADELKVLKNIIEQYKKPNSERKI